MRKTIPFFLCVLLFTACENKLYDTEDSLNREVTLFEEEISVPIGNAGPFNLELVLQNPKVGSFLGTVLTTDEDGTIVSKASEQFYKLSVYEIIAKTPDLSQPFSYPMDNRSFTPSSIANLFQTFGFSVVDQHLRVFVNNPLNKPYTLGGDIHVACLNIKTYETVYNQSFPLADITVERSYSDTPLLTLDIPDSIGSCPTTAELNGWSFNLPANLDQEIRSSSKTEFIFNVDYSCHITPGENAEIPLAMFGANKMSFNLTLPVASYKLKEVEASLKLENTLPLQVTVTGIKLMTGSKPAVDENLLVSVEDLVIKGGSLDTPGITPVTVNIKALEGTIPDITGVQVELGIKAAPGFADTYLSIKQGVSVKSASATLRGGITLGGNE